jgi:hypothetical protein
VPGAVLELELDLPPAHASPYDPRVESPLHGQAPVCCSPRSGTRPAAASVSSTFCDEISAVPTVRSGAEKCSTVRP